jgi:hypothetical protein
MTKKKLPPLLQQETTTELQLLTSPLERTKLVRLPKRSVRAALSAEDGNSRAVANRLFALRASKAVAEDSSNSAAKKLNF